MTVFNRIPDQTVQLLGSLSIDAIAEAARRRGEVFVNIDFGACIGRQSVFDAIASAMALEDWFGDNLDALYDVLTDLPGPPEHGYVFVLQHLRVSSGFSVRDRNALLDVFRDAAACHTDARRPFRVFYTLD